MKVPFTQEAFLGVFSAYNQAIWPVLPLVYLVGVALPALVLVRRSTVPGRPAALLLAVLWLWMGGVYHIGFFSRINPAAYLFGALFIVQGLLLIMFAFARGGLPLRFRGGARDWTGGAFVLYALVVYPLIGYLSGHGYPQAPLFGVAPCPTTIFTFGILLWSQRRVPWYLFVIPLLWSLLGFSAAASFGIIEDFGLPVAGILGTTLILLRRRPSAVA